MDTHTYIHTHTYTHACMHPCMSMAPSLEQVTTPPWATVAMNMPSATTAAHWSLQQDPVQIQVCKIKSHITILKLTPCVINNYSARSPQAHIHPQLHFTYFTLLTTDHITLHSIICEVCMKAAPAHRVLHPGLVGIVCVSRFLYIPATPVL